MRNFYKYIIQTNIPCGHNDNNHKQDKEFTLNCQLCQCEEYDEEIE